MICIGCFSVEFGLRILFCDSLWEFCKDLLNLVDAAAILPFYVELFIGKNCHNAELVVDYLDLAASCVRF